MTPSLIPSRADGTLLLQPFLNRVTWYVTFLQLKLSLEMSSGAIVFVSSSLSVLSVIVSYLQSLSLFLIVT